MPVQHAIMRYANFGVSCVRFTSNETQVQGEPELRFQRMWGMDGNNSLKRIKAIGNRQVDSRRFTDSDYYLSPDFVD